MAERDADTVKLALLAHDLRTPLAAMRLTAELIGTGPLNATQAEQLSILIRSIDALTGMTGDLVAEARSGAPGEAASRKVADIVREVADLFRVAAQAKDLTLEVSIDPAAEVAATPDAASLRRVLTTLLDNAVKYTSRGGVAVALSPTGAATGRFVRRVSVSVTDSGPGIDADEQARLFRPFVRGRRGRESGPGTGLGLWGADELVRGMNGSVVLTRAEGGGCRFEVEIPVGLGAILTGDAGDDPLVPSPVSSGTSSGATSGLTPFHALVVDDNETNCRLLCALLESFGVTTDVAHSGEQAVAMVPKGGYDAVLMDLHMPGMSGVETAELLAGSDGFTLPPMIAVTAALEAIGDARLATAGFSATLTKPLSPVAIYEALAETRRGAAQPA